MNQNKIYMDYNATTPLHPEVKAVLCESMDIYGNPSSLHYSGRNSRALIEDVRRKVAEFIGAEAEEIIFVGSGSEANNTVISRCVCPSCFHKKSCSKDRNEIVVSRIEHPCILETAKCIKDSGVKVNYLDVNRQGRVDIEKLKEMLTSKTKLVSVMMANNEIGTIQDIRSLAEIAHSKGALFHTDAVQAVGKIPVDVKKLNVDFLTISGHKIYGPKGIGALYVKKGVTFCPLIRGGHQEKGRRAGTENVLGIIGLGKAIEMRQLEMAVEEKKLLNLKKIMKKGISDNIPDIEFNGDDKDCLPGTLSVSFYGAEGEAILLYMDFEGIAVSTGSACASGSLDPSHVLLATGVPIEAAHGSLRISLGRDNTLEEVEYVVEKLTLIIEKIRGMSTSYNK
ncbi:MAG: cysteine desulfurase [bacterium]|nr:cysteine desulfurase [bacterium]